MGPTILDGETITVEPAVAPSIRRGDIILFRTRTGVIAHRVVRIERRAGTRVRFIVRGDAMAVFDPPVEADCILGRVVSVERNRRAVSLSSRPSKAYRAARSCASTIKKRLRALRPLPFEGR